MNAFQVLMGAKSAPNRSAPLDFSAEQRQIAADLVDEPKAPGVIVDAVAGSGKTTTILHVVERFTGPVLVLMYNKSLQLDTERRLKNSRNATVRTLHSAAGACLGGRVCDDDRRMMALVEEIEAEDANLGLDPEDLAPNRLGRFDLVVVDEAQDLVPLYLRLVRLILARVGAGQALVMGDFMQCINRYKDADDRFLTRADTFLGDLLPHNPNAGWVHRTLSTTYRCPSAVTTFVNRALLGHDRLVPNAGRPDHGTVTYVHGDVWNEFPVDLYHRIQGFLNQGRRLEDMAVLFPMVTGGTASPCAKMANFLTERGMLVASTANKGEDFDDKTLVGKILFSSIHQFKGRERDVIFLGAFDDGAYFNERKNGRVAPATCDALRYVATTRARQHLVVYQSAKEGPFSWLDVDAVRDTAQVVWRGRGPAPPLEHLRSLPLPDDPLRLESVTGLIKHLPASIAGELFRLIDVGKEGSTDDLDPISFDTHPVAIDTTPVSIETVVDFGTHHEDVSSIYGTAIPLLREKQLKGRVDVSRVLKAELAAAKKEVQQSFIQAQLDDHADLIRRFSDARRPLPEDMPACIADALQIANLHRAVIENMSFMLAQVPHYDWADRAGFEACLSRLDFLSEADTFEEELKVYHHLPELGLHVEVRGFIDAVQGNVPYEFKVTKTLTSDHVLQAALYSAMRRIEEDRLGRPPHRVFRLVNLRTGDMRSITWRTPEGPLTFIDLLLRFKHRTEVVLPWTDLLASVGLEEAQPSDEVS